MRVAVVSRGANSSLTIHARMVHEAAKRLWPSHGHALHVDPGKTPFGGDAPGIMVAMRWEDVMLAPPAGSSRRPIVVAALYDLESWRMRGDLPLWTDKFSATMSRTDFVVAGTPEILEAVRGGATAPARRCPPAWIVRPGVEDAFRFGPLPRQTASLIGRGYRALWVGNTASAGPNHKGLPDVRGACSDAGAELTTADACQMALAHSHESMPEIYAAHDMLVLASQSEGAPRPLLEALAVGIPVVTTRVGLAGELIHHGVNGVIVKRDRGSLGQGIKYVQGMLNERRDTVRRCCQLSVLPDYTESACVERWKSVLDQVALGATWRA